MASLKILLIDDEERVPQGMRVILEEIMDGFQLSATAKNGEQALDLLEFQEFDIIITDIRMPVMNGVDFIKRVRVRLPNIPIVVLSGHDDYEYLRVAIQYGITDYLKKPVNRTELSECLEKIAIQLRGADDIGEEKREQVDSELLLIQQIKKMVEDHLHEEISLKTVAGHFNYNYAYLSTLFKQQTGQSFSEYLQGRRLRKAKKLLKESRLKIYEVAARCGYINTKYFISWFNRSVGMTPSQYRESQ